MRPTKDEYNALPDVKTFVAGRFPGGIVVMHASVYWSDQIFTPLGESEAVQLGIAHNKCVRAELTPDYTVFDSNDVVCAYQKSRKGRPDRRFEKGSDEFNKLIDYDRHIPYIDTEEPGFTVKPWRVTVVAIRRGAVARAVLDHKGGEKDFNSKGSRRRAILQGKRFGTQTVFMVVNSGSVVKESISPRAVPEGSVGGYAFFRLTPR